MADTKTGNEAFTKANQDYFDKLASTYDTQPWQKTMSSKILAFLRTHIDVVVPTPSPTPTSTPQAERAEHGTKVTLLDYACGTGLVTQALQPYITQALGIDISSAMVGRYNTVFESSVPPSPPLSTASTTSPAQFSARAVLGDLLSDPPSSSSSPSQCTDPESTSETTMLTPAHTFDIVAVGLGFHHFADPGDALKRLAQRTREGGTVVIVDFAPFEAGGGHHHSHNHSSHHGHHDHQENSGSSDAKTEVKSNAFPAAATATIKTHGFSEEAMAKLFGEAGLRDFRWREMEREVEMWVGAEGEKRRVTRRVVLGVGVV